MKRKFSTSAVILIILSMMLSACNQSGKSSSDSNKKDNFELNGSVDQ